jgi:hypothetical protein
VPLEWKLLGLRASRSIWLNYLSSRSSFLEGAPLGRQLRQSNATTKKDASASANYLPS